MNCQLHTSTHVDSHPLTNSIRNYFSEITNSTRDQPENHPKNHLVAGLCSAHPIFPLNQWDKLLLPPLPTSKGEAFPTLSSSSTPSCQLLLYFRSTLPRLPPSTIPRLPPQPMKTPIPPSLNAVLDEAIGKMLEAKQSSQSGCAKLNSGEAE